jgi:hypothetical protein
VNQRSFWGLLLIVLGALAIAYQGFTYTTRKKAVDIGSIQITKKEQHAVWVPPLLGALVLVGGIVVLVTGRRDE